MKNRKKLVIAAALGLSLTLVQTPASLSFAQEDVVIESVIESMTDSLTVEVGQSDSIGFTINEGTTGTVITWTSSNSAVASVDSVGTVTGMSPGSATITAVLGGSVKTCNVTVNESSINVKGDGTTDEGNVTVNDDDDGDEEEVYVDDTEDEEDVDINEDDKKDDKKDNNKKDKDKEKGKTKIVVDPSNNSSGTTSSSSSSGTTSTTSTTSSKKSTTPKTADPTASSAMLFAGIAALFGAMGLKKYQANR